VGRLIWPVVAVMIGTAGCSSFRTEMGRPLAPHTKDVFVTGQTQVGAVLERLGPPSQVSALPGGYVFLYEHTIVSEFQFGISVDFSFLKWLKFVHASNHLNEDALLIVFDDTGVLRSIDGKTWREQLSGGNAAQFVFTVISLTDDTVFRQVTPQHEWGTSWLQPLPVALNNGQTLRSGENGVQLRVAPYYAGQQTLEMVSPAKLEAECED